MRGFALVEVLLSVSIFGLLLTFLVGGLIYGQESTALSGARTRATFLAEEGLEAVRNVRDANYSNLTFGSSGLSFSTGNWTLSGSSDTTDIFQRSVTISPVDANRKKIVSTTSWQQNLQRVGSISLTTYLTNWRRDNGAIVPITPETTLNLPGSGSGTEIALYKVGGSTYAIECRISSSDQELYVIDVTNPSSPAVSGSLEIGSNVNGLAVVGSYVYLATSDNSNELQVVSLATPASPALAGNLDLAGNADAQTIAASGNNLYIGRISSTEPEIDSISISTPTAPALLSTLEVGDSVWKVTLSQNNSYLYSATGSNTSEFIVIDASNPSSITQTGTLNLSGNSDATAVETIVSLAALGRDDGSVSIIDVSTPSTPIVTGGPLTIGTKINDLTIGPGDAYLFAASGTVGGEVTVVDIGTPSSPSLFFSISLSGNEATGVIWDSVSNRLFGSATSNTSEFFVIKSP